MHPRLRTVIAIVFLLLFVVTAPVVILYTAGYGFNWKRHRIEKTGSIQIGTIPGSAKVLLDGVPQKNLTPSSYARLLPDDYDVRILERGYLPWQKTLTVQSGETTFATGITLYQDVLPRLTLDAHADVAAWSPDGKSLAYVTDDGKWQEVSVLTNDQSTTLLARFPHATYAGVALSWSPKGDAVLFIATAGGATHILKFSADGITPALAVQAQFPKGTLRARWSLDGNAIIVMDSAGASSVDPTTGVATPLRLAPGLLDADVRGQDAYTLRTVSDVNAPMVVVERGAGAAATTVAELPSGNYRFVTGTDRFLAIVDMKKGRMMLVDLNDGTVDAYDGTAIIWDTKNDRALVWNDFEISLINLNDGSETLITRLGTIISDCAWSPSGDAVIYATPNAISVAEFNGDDGRVVLDLVRFSEIGTFAVDAQTDMIRFVGSIGPQHGVYERDL
jgi:dipeptidyl aminopeptidase/acylaminoacyl peptidase